VAAKAGHSPVAAGERQRPAEAGHGQVRVRAEPPPRQAPGIPKTLKRLDTGQAAGIA